MYLIKSDGNDPTETRLTKFLLRPFPHQSLKKELDSLLEEKIRNPAPVDWQNRQSKDCAVITAIIDLITTQEKSTGGGGGGGGGPSRAWGSAPRGQRSHFNDDDDDDDE